MLMTGVPTERAFESMVRLNQLQDCPISIDNVKNAHLIWGDDLANKRGKTVRRKPDRVEAADYVEIPRALLFAHESVTLVADVFFVNSVPFLVSTSRNINLITIEHAPHRKAPQLGHLLQRITKVYARAGFWVRTILMDNEFEKVRQHIPMIDMNTPAAVEHVAEIERRIRTIKERSRAITCTLPYKALPNQILIRLLNCVVMWINNMPSATGISTQYSPRELILRTRLKYKQQFVLYSVPFARSTKIINQPILWRRAQLLLFAVVPLATFKALTSSSASSLVY